MTKRLDNGAVGGNLMRSGFFFGKNELAKIKSKAMRRGIWFRVLTWAERAQMDLTMRIVERIRSNILAEVVTAIIKKLLDAMGGKVAHLMREAGRAIARRLSRIAHNWGNKFALYWEADLSFVRYLTVCYMNEPRMFEAKCNNESLRE